MTEDEVNQTLTDGSFSNRKKAIIAIIAHKRSNTDMTETLRTLNIDMWSILSAKAEGEAEEQLEGCNQGEGLWAYVRIHLWFTRSTDQSRSMRRAAILNPSKCQYEHEISAAIERWEEKYRTLKEDDREIEFPDAWKMTSLKMMLCGEIQKSVEHREKEFKTYDELRAVVMKWAINRKIENERSTHEPLDCNPINWDPNWGAPEEWNWGTQTQEETNTQQPTDLNYVNSGKGKGDGKSGGYSGGGKGTQAYNAAQYFFQMMMKSMKGGTKGTYNQGGQFQGKGVQGGQ